MMLNRFPRIEFFKLIHTDAVRIFHRCQMADIGAKCLLTKRRHSLELVTVVIQVC